jgi:ATP-dependent 26S proteasome regulatory subunit
MMELPKKMPGGLPNGLSLEKPAKNLASLATTGPLRDLTSIVIAQWKHTDAFAKLAKHGIRPVDRMLFYGPPGNGKTMASQWLAHQVGVPLYRVRCETLISKWLGESASRVSEVMQWLECQPCCVVLFDEVEQILPAREGLSGSSAGRDVGSMMTVFWQFLDRWDAQTLFILATNLPERLDKALLSRIDLKMEFGPPTVEQSESVVRYWMEVLHEYGSEQWGPELLADNNFESFRALFQAIQHRVREHVVKSNG